MVTGLGLGEVMEMVLGDVMEMVLGKGVSVKQDSDLGFSVSMMMLKYLVKAYCYDKHSVSLHFCVIVIGPYKASAYWGK